ncbi:parvalbumin beta-like [Tenrec ecaudatus]|uniref:parvalbumin beta-like n=1 Tax=Tenrec ecaudatus TaxID=94439 RepID=UPI003F5A123B
MTMTDIISSKDIEAALFCCKDPGSFNYKTFFFKAGMSNKDKVSLKKIFNILDRDKSGFIKEDELRQFLQNFSPSARMLTDNETKEFLQACDTGGDGKIGVDKFLSLVKF